jgi:hypothetical protein
MGDILESAGQFFDRVGEFLRIYELDFDPEVGDLMTIEEPAEVQTDFPISP